MVTVFTSKSQKIGLIGEEVACKFLMKHGFEVIERNYTRKWGEIDIIAKKSNVLHLIEVKSVSCVTLNGVLQVNYDPVQNMHHKKLNRLARAVQTYLIEKNSKGYSWQFDYIGVFIDLAKRISKVQHLEDLIIT